MMRSFSSSSPASAAICIASAVFSTSSASITEGAVGNVSGEGASTDVIPSAIASPTCARRTGRSTLSRLAAS